MTLIEFSKMLEEHPLAMHINPIGLFRLGRSNNEIFQKFDIFLNEIEKSGGNIAIPTYSYSYAKKEPYNIKTSSSDLDEVSEYLRKHNYKKRTIDGNFSYLLFGNGFSKQHFQIQDYSSFGEKSLIEEIFLKDGYIGSIGNAFEYSTEIHFLERLLKINYRFDKEFEGITIDHEGNRHQTNLVYYCRDLDSSYTVSFVQLKEDLKKANLIQTIKIDEYRFKIELIKFKDVYHFIKTKLIENPKYLWEVQ